MTSDRQQLRQTFESAADLYQAARPEYPAALYGTLIRRAGLRPGARLLEVGCATGKATLPLARRGFAVTCVELGPELAAAARRNLASFPDVEVVTASFEDWPPSPGTRDQEAPGPGPAGWDLVFAATAWHWIDPEVRYRRAWELLRPGGNLAFWSAGHVRPETGGDPIFGRLQEVYAEIGQGDPRERLLTVAELADDVAEIEASGLFGDVSADRFDWEIRYDADGYIRLLDTFSGHIAMAPWQRDRLYGEIRRLLAQRPDGQLRRHWGGVLQVARRRDDPAR